MRQPVLCGACKGIHYTEEDGHTIRLDPGTCPGAMGFPWMFEMDIRYVTMGDPPSPVFEKIW